MYTASSFSVLNMANNFTQGKSNNWIEINFIKVRFLPVFSCKNPGVCNITRNKFPDFYLDGNKYSIKGIT